MQQPLTIDRKIFFDAVRNDPFPGRLTEGQVSGINRLLDVWEEHYAPLGWNPLELDYNLATSFHETGAVMQPIMERGDESYFMKYDIEGNPRKAKILGNTKPGDGFLFRGAGDVQNTGRRNAIYSGERLSKLLGRTIDFVAKPELRLDPILSAHCLFLGNHEGWWTGRKLPDMFEDGVEDWKNNRTVVNGTDRWREIGEYAVAFGLARKAALVLPLSSPPADSPRPLEQTRQASVGWSAELLAMARQVQAEDLPVSINVEVNISGNFTRPASMSAIFERNSK